MFTVNVASGVLFAVMESDTDENVYFDVKCEQG